MQDILSGDAGQVPHHLTLELEMPPGQAGSAFQEVILHPGALTRHRPVTDGVNAYLVAATGLLLGDLDDTPFDGAAEAMPDGQIAHTDMADIHRDFTIACLPPAFGLAQ